MRPITGSRIPNNARPSGFATAQVASPSPPIQKLPEQVGGGLILYTFFTHTAGQLRLPQAATGAVQDDWPTLWGVADGCAHGG